MEPLKEYCKLKAMPDEDRANYFLMYVSMIDDPLAFIKALKDFVDIFAVISKDENAELFATFERLKLHYNKRKALESKKEQSECNDSTLPEARVIPLFPKNSR
jgi:hypothetical protein